MGAHQVTWTPEHTLPDFERITLELETGIEVHIDDVSTVGGLLTYAGQQVLLYIRDNTSREGVLEDPESGNRFHVAYCRTLDEMREKNRYERYVSTTRRDGIFTIDYTMRNGQVGTTEGRLCVCKNCLAFLSYNGYPARKDEVWNGFDLNEFFGMYSTFFPVRPTRTDRIAVPEQYVRDWSRISAMVRSQRNWTCENEKCGVKLDAEPERKWLHVHHVSGVRTDNRMSNLKVLCIECHSKQPGHEWLKVPEAAKQILKQKRSPKP